MAQRIQRSHVLRQRQQQRAARQHHRQEEERALRQIVHRVRHAQPVERQPQALQALLRRQTRSRVLQDRAELGNRGEIEVLAELLEVFGEDEAGFRRVVRQREQQQHYASNPQPATHRTSAGREPAFLPASSRTTLDSRGKPYASLLQQRDEFVLAADGAVRVLRRVDGVDSLEQLLQIALDGVESGDFRGEDELVGDEDVESEDGLMDGENVETWNQRSG